MLYFSYVENILFIYDRDVFYFYITLHILSFFFFFFYYGQPHFILSFNLNTYGVCVCFPFNTAVSVKKFTLLAFFLSCPHCECGF